MTQSPSVFTPISVAFLPEPLITWADLRGIRFAEPFFRQTIARVASTRPKLITGIEALRAADAHRGLPPALIVFHSSRCGSTLLAQMLAALPTHRVLSEAQPINQALTAPLPDAERIELLRLLVGAFGRNGDARARHLVIKLTSWNVHFAGIFRAAFPTTPLLWLQRDPAAVVASQVARPAGWTQWQATGDPALAWLGMTAAEAQAMSPTRFVLQAIEAAFTSAAAAVPNGPWHVVDHAQLPAAVWQTIAAHAGISWQDGDVDRLQERARHNAKVDVTQPYLKRDDRENGDDAAGLPDEAKAFIRDRIAPLYRALGQHEPALHQLQDRRLDV